MAGCKGVEEGARVRATLLLGRTNSGRMSPWPGFARNLDGDGEVPEGDRHLGSMPWLPEP